MSVPRRAAYLSVMIGSSSDSSSCLGQQKTVDFVFSLFLNNKYIEVQRFAIHWVNESIDGDLSPAYLLKRENQFSSSGSSLSGDI